MLAGVCHCNGDDSIGNGGSAGSAGAGEVVVVETYHAGAGGSLIFGPTVGGSAGGGASGAAPTCTPPAAYSLELDVFSQQSSVLCWAAVSQMLASYFGLSVASQCSELERRNPAGCGQDPSVECCRACVGCRESVSTPVGVCNYGSWPDFAALGLKFRQTDDGVALSLEQLKEEIACHRRPVAFTWRLGAPTVGHIMVAYGYSGDRIAIADPLRPCEGSTRDIPYAMYRDGNDPGSTSHWTDFYGLERIDLP